MTANAIVLVSNGLTLALGLGLLLLVLWHDATSEANRYFSLFLLMVMVWASGSLLGRAAAFVNAGENALQTGLRLLDSGFMGASISLYVYSAVITGYQGRLLRVSTLAVLVTLFAYQLFLLFTGIERAYDISDDGILIYGFDRPSMVTYLFFQGATLGLVWYNRQKIRARVLTYGILLFCVGQILGLVSPRFRMMGVPEDISALAALMMS
ncbi:MAG: hypothetical protein GYB65_14035, partial [Chloroflexi bacterium]|nr:hypothetical protein [Chloroflexota bacterium]